MIRHVQRLTSYWGFLAAVMVIYVAVGIASPPIAVGSLAAFANIMVSIIPILVLVFGIMFVTNLIIKRGVITRHLGEGSGMKGWFIAIAGGILSSGPPYLWYPLLSDLKEEGMRNSLIAGFLYSRAVKIPFIPVMLFYFGLEFTVVATALLIVFSVINGVVVERIVGR